MINRISISVSLCGSGSRPLNTRMAHLNKKEWDHTNGLECSDWIFFIPVTGPQSHELQAASFLNSLLKIFKWYLVQRLAPLYTWVYHKSATLGALLVITENTTYHLSNPLLRLASKLWRRHSRCMNKDLHVPSSTSCITSTTKVGNMLNPCGDNFSENAFYCRHQTRV